LSEIARTPAPPYYAVIFTSQQNEDTAGYAEMAQSMVALARRQPGFLGMESAHDDIGITVSYWQDLESIRAWKANLDHQKAQQLGRNRWYAGYRVRITRVDREYGVPHAEHS
jgi:heme-degrading monooxygenase HmoA